MRKSVDSKAPEFSELPFGLAYPSTRVCVCVCFVYVHKWVGEGDGCIVFPVSQFTVF